MSEGRVFRAAWRREAGQYIVIALDLEDVEASGVSFDEADRKLGYEIGMATGDGENTREYTVAPPDEEGGTAVTNGAYRWLGVGSVELTNAHGLFTRGYCSACLTPQGERTDVPLAVAPVKAGARAARAFLPHCTSVGPSFTIVSTPVLERLSTLGGSEFEARPVRVERAKTDWFELRPAHPPVPYVGYRDQKVNELECATCGMIWVGPKSAAGMIRCVAERVAQGRPLLFMGEPEYAILAMEETRWYEVNDDAIWRAVKTTRVGVIGDADIGHEVERAIRTPLNPRLIKLALGGNGT